MPIYSYQCQACGAADERYIRLRDYDAEAHNQTCECGATMKKLVTVPVLAGLDSGPEGFLRGRTENDGCADSFTRREVEANLGHKLNGGTFVPGLCRPGVMFDPQAVVYGRSEVIKKAQQLGVGVRGPGINVEPRRDEAAIKAQEEDDGRPCEQALWATTQAAIRERFGGRCTEAQKKKLVAELQEKHARKKPPAARKIDSLRPILNACKIVE